MTYFMLFLLCNNFILVSDNRQVCDLDAKERFFAYEGGPTFVNEGDWQKLFEERMKILEKTISREKVFCIERCHLNDKFKIVHHSDCVYKSVRR